MTAAIRRFGSVAALLVIPAACLYAQTVRVNWQTKAPFSDYKSYAWKFTEKRPAGFYRQWVVADMNAAMAGKGFKKVKESQHPDLYLTYNFLTQEVLDSTTTSDGFGWDAGGWGFRGGWGGWDGMDDDVSTTETEPRMMGILTVDLVDARKQRVVWRGQSTEDALSSSQKGDEKQIQKSIEKMLKSFPPK